MDAITKPKKKPPPSVSPSYPDLHDHIRALDKAGLLITVDRPINKDTEMHPLVRWQFRGGIEEKDRKAFLFTNVVDSKGRKYDIPVLVGGLAANREIYRIGLGCRFEEMDARWVRATQNPIPPRIVDDAPCHEIVITGRALDKPGNGLDGIPLPISTPGWDIAPYATLSQYITKDPDTGVQNMGNYRGQVKARRRLGMNPSLELRPGIYNHWERLRAQGFKKLPCAVVLGAPPCVTFASVQKIPETLDELHVAGALVGTALNVVKAKTVDLLVPAEAEIVIEGFIDTEYLEPEAPFGESHGHVNLQEFNAYMDVTAITRRRDAILTSIISQVTPSESSVIKRIGMEPLFLNFLKNTLGIKGIKRVSMHEPLTNIRKVIALICERDMPTTEILARPLRRRGAASRGRKVRDRRQRRHRPGQRRRDPMGDVVPRQSKPRLPYPAAPRPGAWPPQQAQRRAGRLGADRRDAEGELSADLAAQARVHGARQGDLGRARAAEAQAGSTVVRLFARRMAAGDGRSSPTGGARRLFRDRRAAGKTPTQGRSHEYGGAKRRRAQTKTGQAQTVLNRRRRSPAGDLRAPALPDPTTPGQRGCSQCRTTLSQARSNTRYPSASANGSRSTPSFPGFRN